MTTKAREALQCLVRKTAAGETEAPEAVLGKARARKPSALVNLVAPRIKREQIGEAVGLAEAGGVEGIRATDRWPALRTLFHVSTGAAAGASILGPLGAVTGAATEAGPAKGLALGALGGALTGGFVGLVSQAEASGRRTKDLTGAGLAGLSKRSPGEVKGNVEAALRSEPEILGALFGTGQVHRGRLRALAAATGNNAGAPLNQGLSAADAVSRLLEPAGTPVRLGISVYDTLAARKSREALLDELSAGGKGRA